MIIKTNEAVKLIKENDNFLILTHMNPDGDTLGCGFGLCRALHKLGKKARVINSDTIPQKFEYMYEGLENEEFEEKFIIAVDIATTALLGEKLSVYKDKVDLCIDHHGTNTDYAKKTLLDADAGAACELIYEIVCSLGIQIDKKIADCLYTGLSTDTGCFKYDNATSRTYHIGANLLDFGADSAKINRIMFDTKTKTFIRLYRLALDGMRLHFGDRCAVMKITQEMYKKTGSNESETDALVPLTRQIEGVIVGITFKEKPDGTCKASVRTRDGFSASELCKVFGGGGHVQAAATTFDVGVEEAEKLMLEQVEKMLG